MSCPTCHQPVPEKPLTETRTVDGISYKVHRWRNGTTVDSPCQCFGVLGRCHSTPYCPWLMKRALQPGAYSAKVRP